MESEYSHRDYSPLSVEDLIEELQKIEDKSKRVMVSGHGDLDFVNENSDLDYIVITGKR